ncbi:tyrosine-type recombinase/integrase [Nocardioides caldifontis]|uniref:tyrosine-type recombinase/integrase n=1 Tax=Nocardioides caldifontis TaxID=2588938 RepID=UPI003B84AE92
MLACCHQAGLLTRTQWKSAAAFTTTAGEQRPPAGHHLSEEDVAVIIRACERGSGGVNTRIRDVALLLALATSGARRDEVHHVRIEDVELDQDRFWLPVTKSGVGRYAWLHPTAVTALQRWLEVRGSAPGGLFVPLSRTVNRPGFSGGWVLPSERSQTARSCGSGWLRPRPGGCFRAPRRGVGC